MPRSQPVDPGAIRNGNLTSGLGRTVAYTSFNLPSRIEQRNAAGITLLAALDFTYDSDYGRIKQVNGGTTTIYLNPRIDLGGTYTKETTGTPKDTTITHRWVVYAGGRPVAEMIREDNSTVQTWKPRWYHTNHLGSLVALTDETGTVVERLSYDAWGKRRNLNGSADTGTFGTFLRGANTPRGYTLHEHLEAIALVHMNGRVYDPLLGRFLQADPLIQAPGNLQSYNRYSYVLNNPLMFADPSGLSFWTKWLRPFVIAVAAYWTGTWIADAWAASVANASVQTTVAALLAGSRRYAHIAGVRGDAVAAQALGLRGIVSEDSVRRALKAIEPAAGENWMRSALMDSVREALGRSWIFDVDTTIKPLYGRQESRY